MTKKKPSVKEKMTKKQPDPQKKWAELCHEHDKAQKEVSIATYKAVVKGKLRTAPVKALADAFDRERKIKKKMKKFLKKHQK